MKICEKIKNRAAERDGAASVMVILVMIVLVTLGAFAVTSANVNYKFSQQALGWNNSFFRLDAAAEEFLAKADSLLAEAEAAAYGYMRENAAEINLLNNSQKNEKFAKVYLEYVDIYLEKLKDDYENLEIMRGSSALYDSNTTVKVMFYADGSEEEVKNGRGLYVSFAVKPLEYSPEVRMVSVLRYDVTDWREFQEAVGGDGTAMELWDGSF